MTVLRYSLLALLSASLSTAYARGLQNAAAQEKRQIGPVEISPADLTVLTTATTPSILILITPSPGAPPIAVTSQSQVVTTYVPQLTLCVLPTPTHAGIFSSTRFYNTSRAVATPALGTDCTTIYIATPTTVCATTLTGIATQYTVSRCDQDITFSSQYGYSLVTPTISARANATGPSLNTSAITPAPTVHTYTTFWAAQWQALSTIGTTQDIDVEVCDSLDSGARQCVQLREIWSTELVTITSTTSTHIELETTLYGPSQLVLETYTVDVTAAMTTFSITTDLILERPTETANTITRTVTPTASAAMPDRTETETITVEEATMTT